MFQRRVYHWTLRVGIIWLIFHYNGYHILILSHHEIDVANTNFIVSSFVVLDILAKYLASRIRLECSLVFYHQSSSAVWQPMLVREWITSQLCSTVTQEWTIIRHITYVMWRHNRTHFLPRNNSTNAQSNCECQYWYWLDSHYQYSDETILPS